MSEQEQQEMSVEEAIAQRVQDAAAGDFGERYYKNEMLKSLDIEEFVPKATNIVQFIQPAFPKGYWGYLCHVHRWIGADNLDFTCLEKGGAGKGPCPICIERDRASARGDDEMKKDYRPSKRYLYWVIDLSEDVTINVDRVKLFQVSEYLFDQELLKRVSRNIAQPGGGVKAEITIISNPKKPFAVSFSKKGEKRGLEFFGFDLQEGTPFADQDFSALPALPDLINYQPQENLKRAVQYGTTRVQSDDPGHSDSDAPVNPEATTASLQDRVAQYKKDQEAS